ncbi:MAG: hypothetical protein E6G50_00650 [Actinobacteria bacterium]|nr:MAG: hypothetical protein E6G50_00650 [Actinomycetota bacterium]
MRGRTLAAVAAVLAAFPAVTAGAAETPAGGPDLGTMALATNDFGPGARIAFQGSKPPPSPAVASYQRIFGPAVRLGGHRLLTVVSTNDGFADGGTASNVFATVESALSTSAGRTELGNLVLGELNSAAGGALHARLAGVGSLVSVQLGQGAFRILVRVKTRLGTLDIALGGIVLDRALGLVLLVSYPKKHVGAATALLALRKLAPHFQYGFTVRNLTPPTIGGAPQAGQTLTADPGRWAGAPSSFAFQWSRCDAAGSNCAPIAGAVGQTYVLGTAEIGTRINVTVTAANTVTSQSLAAAATSAVK